MTRVYTGSIPVGLRSAEAPVLETSPNIPVGLRSDDVPPGLSAVRIPASSGVIFSSVSTVMRDIRVRTEVEALLDGLVELVLSLLEYFSLDELVAVEVRVSALKRRLGYSYRIGR